MNKPTKKASPASNMYESIKASSRIVLRCLTECIFGLVQLFTEQKAKIIGRPEIALTSKCLKRFHRWNSIAFYKLREITIENVTEIQWNYISTVCNAHMLLLTTTMVIPFMVAEHLFSLAFWNGRTASWLSYIGEVWSNWDISSNYDRFSTIVFQIGIKIK